MYNIQLGSDGYWTGAAVPDTVRVYDNGINVEAIPSEDDMTRRRAYKLVDGVLVLDTVRLAEIEEEIAAAAAAQTEAERIAALEADNAELRAAIEVLIGTEVTE